jgi:Fe-S-cluster containining protein
MSENTTTKEKDGRLGININWKTITKKEIKNIINTCIKNDNLLFTFLPLDILFDREKRECRIKSPQCKKCAKCCKKFTGERKPNFIEMSENDITRIKKIRPNFNYQYHETHENNVKIYKMPSPCQFLNKNCTIYDHRPDICRIYPLQIPEKQSGNEPMATLDAECPMAVLFIRKLYNFHREISQKKERKMTRQDINNFFKNNL